MGEAALIDGWLRELSPGVTDEEDSISPVSCGSPSALARAAAYVRQNLDTDVRAV